MTQSILRDALLKIATLAKQWEGRSAAPYWNLGDIATNALQLAEYVGTPKEIKFIRSTHKDGVVRNDLTKYDGRSISCSIHMLEDYPQTIAEILAAHQRYAKQFEGDEIRDDTTLPDILEGLAILLRWGWATAVEVE